MVAPNEGYLISVMITNLQLAINRIFSRPFEKPLRLCFTVPASPTDGFFSQIAMFRLALDKLGGNYKQADIVLSLGAESILKIPEKWERAFGDGVKLNWADPSYYRQVGMRAHGEKRWQHNYDDYDLIIFHDADTILLKSIDELLIELSDSNSVAGVLAHYPFPHLKDEHPAELWQTYAKKFIGRTIPLEYQYSLIADDNSEDAKCPFYVNFGFVIMTPSVYREIRNTLLEIRRGISPMLINPSFASQVAFALAVLKHNIPVKNLGMQYNFPNDHIAEKRYPQLVNSIAVIHYLRTSQFDRQKIFVSESSFSEFLSLDLSGINKIFQQYIRKLTEGIYPF